MLMDRPSCHLSLLFGVLLGLLPAVAGAQSRKRAAAEAFAAGSRQFRQLNYLGAIESFQRAYRLLPHYAALCNIARCYEGLGDMIQAAKAYRRCLSKGADRSKQATKLREAQKRVEARITWIQVNSPGKGGTIYLGGKQIGVAPKRVPLNPGRRVLEVRRPGAEPASTTIITQGGELRTVELKPIDHLVAGPTTPTTQPAQPSPTPPRRISRFYFWSGTVLTAIVVGAAVGLGVYALSRKRAYEEFPTYDNLDLAKETRLAANLVWAAAGLAAGTTATLYFFTEFPRDANAGRSRRDGSALSAVGLGLRGSF